MKPAVLFVCLSVVGGAMGQLFMKLGVLTLSTVSILDNPIGILASPGLYIEVLIGLLLYVCSVFSWLKALQYFELNRIYPTLALGYAIVYIAAAYWPGLEESLSIQKSFGVLLIILGVVLATKDRGGVSA